MGQTIFSVFAIVELLVFVVIVHVQLAFAANGSVVYTNDALGRITTSSYDTGIVVIYTYDANGNRTAQTINVNTNGLVWGAGNWDQTLWQ